MENKAFQRDESINSVGFYSLNSDTSVSENFLLFNYFLFVKKSVCALLYKLYLILYLYLLISETRQWNKN